MKLLIIMILLGLIYCCGESKSKPKEQPNSWQPKTISGCISYEIEDFEEITAGQQKDHNFWLALNHARTEVGVFNIENKIVFRNPLAASDSYLDLEDGKLEGINHGEFGGGLNFIPANKTKDTITILNSYVNVVSVFRFNDEIYFLTGIAHMMDQGGSIVKLIRDGDRFKCEEVLKLSSSPEAMMIYKDKIIIAGHQNFVVVKEDLKKDFSIENTFWGALYPSSIAVLNNSEVYVGFRGGYAKISMDDQSIKYFKHNSVDLEVNHL